jgi:hypothetical protein
VRRERRERLLSPLEEVPCGASAPRSNRGAVPSVRRRTRLPLQLRILPQTPKLRTRSWRFRPRVAAGCVPSSRSITAKPNSRPITFARHSRAGAPTSPGPCCIHPPTDCRPVQFDERSDRPAGHVFTLPYHRVPSSDAKDRGYVLLNRCAPPEIATLAFRSSKPTERDQFGAPAVVLDTPSVSPAVHSYARRNAKGAVGHSIMYPTRLVSWPSSELERSLSDGYYASQEHPADDCRRTWDGNGHAPGLRVRTSGEAPAADRQGHRASSFSLGRAPDGAQVLG